MSKFDPVPELSRKHFEEALRHARKSVTNMVIIIFYFKDLNKFEEFRKKFDPSFNKGGSGKAFNLPWPE